MLQIKLLGDFCVTVGTKPLTTLNKPRLQSLLAYLILHRDAPQLRYHLANILWPDSDEAQAHTNLRNLAHLLRRALPEGEALILSTNQTLQWNAEIPLQIDVFEFQACLGESMQAVPLEGLETALCLYRGDLLPGCYDDWISSERAGLRRAWINLLCELIERYETLRRYPEAATCAQRLIEAEPLQKDGYLRLMRLFALSGDGPSALKTYQDYAKLLRRELGTAPEADVDELRSQIAQGGKKNLAGRAQSIYEAIPLVGRGAEWQAMHALWKTAARGSPRMLVISGEAGIGKSRLAEEMVSWAARQGIRTAAAHCYASEGSLPYAPVVAWLRTLGLPALEKVWQTELSRLMPELLSSKDTQPEPLTEAWQRVRLFEALSRAVLAQKQPTLLWIDDLQWGDQVTLEWLHYLLHFNASAPLLVVGTARSEETAANPACTRLLSDLRQEGGHLELELGPLNEGETRLLADTVAGKPLEAGVGSLLFAETEGSPLFIVETVRAELYKTVRLPGVQPLPYKARAVLENRVHQLSPRGHEIALLAATVGRAFSFDLLCRSSDSGEMELLHGLDELLQRRIVREMGRDTYLFSHDKLRDAVLSSVSGAHRRILHRRLAKTLLDLSDTDREDRFGAIAGHYEQAGLESEAFKYFLLAANSARKLFANDRAIEYYQRALALCDGQNHCPNASVEDTARLYEQYGEVQALMGAYPQALASFEAALRHPFPAPGLWRSQVYRKECDALIPKYEHGLAFAALDRAEEALGLQDGGGTVEERQEWLQIQLTRSQLLYWGNHPEEMDAIIHKIQPLVEQYGRPDQHAELLSQQCMALNRHERYRLSAKNVEIARRRLALTEVLGNVYDTAWAQFMLGFAILWHGDPAAARGWLAAAHEKAVQMGATLPQVRCLTYLSIVSRYCGDIPALQKQLTDLLPQATAINEYAYIGICHANLGWLAWRDGKTAAAREECAAAYEIWKKSGGDMFHCLADWILLAIAVSEKDVEQATVTARALLSPDPLTQPVLAPAGGKLEEGLRAREAGEIENALALFRAAVELAKASHEL